MWLNFHRRINQGKVYDEPQLVVIPIDPHRRNYDFEVVSGSFWDIKGNEYLSKDQALIKGVKESDILFEEDVLDEHVCLAYRYEKSYSDKVNHANAKKAGFGVIKMIKGDQTGTEYMYCLYQTIRALNILIYGYLTHGFVDLKLLNKIKTDKKLQNELSFILGNNQDVYSSIMNYGK